MNLILRDGIRACKNFIPGRSYSILNFSRFQKVRQLLNLMGSWTESTILRQKLHNRCDKLLKFLQPRACQPAGGRLQISAVTPQVAKYLQRCSAINYHYFSEAAANRQLPTAYRQLPTTSCQLPSTKYQLPTTNCRLPTANCQLLSANCQLTTTEYQLSAANE